MPGDGLAVTRGLSHRQPLVAAEGAHVRLVVHNRRRAQIVSVRFLKYGHQAAAKLGDLAADVRYQVRPLSVHGRHASVRAAVAPHTQRAIRVRPKRYDEEARGLCDACPTTLRLLDAGRWGGGEVEA